MLVGRLGVRPSRQRATRVCAGRPCAHAQDHEPNIIIIIIIITIIAIITITHNITI